MEPRQAAASNAIANSEREAKERIATSDLELIPGEYSIPILGPALKALSAPGAAAGNLQKEAQKPLEKDVAHPSSIITEPAEQAAKAIAAPIGEAISGLGSSLVSAIKPYALRGIEIIAGFGLLAFGLLTIIKGGQPPKLPAAIPVPV